MSKPLTFLDDNFRPVTEEVTTHDLAVTGTIPAELEGRLLRIGPNPRTPPDPATYHWFTGDGMVHGVRLRGGRAEWYRNRWVQGDAGEVVNTHVVGIDGRTFALVEAGNQPVELTDDLDVVGTCAFDGTLEGAFSAHAHEDPATGDRHAVAYHWTWDHIRHIVVGPDARVRREVHVPVADGPMVHDCAITERHVVLFDLPVTFDLELATGGSRLPYRWNPDHPPRVGLMPLDGPGGDVRWFEAPSCYVFHTLNAYEDDGRVVVDLVRHPRMFATALNGPDEGDSVLERWTIDPVAGTLRTAVLDDRSQEFPRMDERLTGRPHRYGYGVAVADGFENGPALKHDLVAGTTAVHDHGPGRVTLEPVFVPRSPTAVPAGSSGASGRTGSTGAAEDDGWVMSYVYDAATDRSDVVILDAQDFAGPPVATVHLPARVPFGFHGSWIPDG